MNRIGIFLMSALLLAGGAVAQDAVPRDHVHTFTFTQDEPLKTTSPIFNLMLQREKLPASEIALLGAEMASAGEVVTAAPYAATATTESTQTLADGNRIVNKTSSFVARDSQGRTRREASVGRIGPLQVNSLKLVFINDPTTHVQYILQPSGEATKVVRSEGAWSEGPQIIDLHVAGERGTKTKMMVSTQGGPETHVEKETGEQVKHEDLGTQTIEGVSAEGERDTVTIPAGQIGNERAIEIVSETWYSPELHTMVLSKH
jgi:hypothetical protein